MKKLIVIASLFIMATASANLEEIFGNGNTGDYCRSDYECGSLCCHKSSSRCGEHDSTGGGAISCNKSAGDSCITSEFCKAEVVVICKIYKTGTNPDGSPACVMRCPAVEVRGACVNNICRGPIQPPIPPFDPNDCSQAIDP